MNLSFTGRPSTLSEVAAVYGVSVQSLTGLAARHGIRPACRFGSVGVYTGVELRQISSAIAFERGRSVQPPRASG